VPSTRSRPRGREHARPSTGGVAAEHSTKIYAVALSSVIVVIAFLAFTGTGHVIDAATQHFMLFYAGVFALIALCISVVAFPLMLDRRASAAEAMVTSLRTVGKNPVTMATWGLIVAALLVAGSIPFFLGLAVVVPLLGHATWHLYRAVIAPDPNAQPIPPRPQLERRFAADFPAALFSWHRKNDT